jgi:two-component system sensor histidine kinase/response regulator
MNHAPARTEAAQPGDRTWDPETFVQGLGGDLQLATELVTLFRGECPGLLAAVRHAIDGRDAEAIRRAAHTFKGAIANFTTSGAHVAAGTVERLAQVADLSGTAEAMAALEREIAGLLRAMGDWDEAQQRRAS